MLSGQVELAGPGSHTREVGAGSCCHRRAGEQLEARIDGVPVEIRPRRLVLIGPALSADGDWGRDRLRSGSLSAIRVDRKPPPEVDGVSRFHGHPPKPLL